MPVVASFYIGFDIDLYEFAKTLNIVHNRQNCYVKFEKDDVCMRIYPKGKALIWTSKDLAYLNDARSVWIDRIRKHYPVAQVINGEIVNTDGDTQPFAFAELYNKRLPFNTLLRVVKYEDDEWRKLEIRRYESGKSTSEGVTLYFMEFHHIIRSLHKMIECYYWDLTRQRNVILSKISEDPLRWSILIRKYQEISDVERLYEDDKEEELILSTRLCNDIIEIADEIMVHLYCHNCFDIYDYTSEPHHRDCGCDCHLEYIPFPIKMEVDD